MKLFDFFKSESKSNKELENSHPIKIAIQKLKKSQSAINVQEFSNSIYESINSKQWLPILGKNSGDKGFAMDYRFSDNKAYLSIFTDNKEIKRIPNGYTIIVTDVNKVIDSVFGNTQIKGIVINPDTDQMFLEKYFLLKVLLHSQYPMHNKNITKPINWGNGIPQYSETDKMTDEEFLNFAMNQILNYECKKNGYTFVSANDNIDVCPNIILEKDGCYHFVVVKGYCDNSEPEIDIEIKTALLTLGKKYNAKCYYAPVGFGSTDNDRFNAFLALKGDSYYLNYTGLKEVI